MGLIKEPKNIDLSTKSKPWTKEELADFRELMQHIKFKNKRKQMRNSTNKHKTEKVN